MKHWLRTIALTASVSAAVGPLAIAPPSSAHADASAASQAPQPQPTAMFHQGGGLATQALNLGSLTRQQRAQIEQLVSQRRSAAAPVRQANRRLLAQLADQVEHASIDEGRLAPAVGAVDARIDAAMPVQLDSLNRLHRILTPDQRNTLIDHVEARLAQRRAAAQNASASDAGTAEAGPELAWTRLGLTPEQKSEAWRRLRAARSSQPTESLAQRTSALLEGFRSEGFDAHAFARPTRAGEREQRFAEGILPLLTPAQRTTFAEILRERAHRA